MIATLLACLAVTCLVTFMTTAPQTTPTAACLNCS